MHYILLLILTLFTILLRLVFDLSYYDLQRFILLFFLTAVAIYFIRDKRGDVPVTRSLIAFCVILFIGVISTIANGYITTGLSEVLHFSILIFTAIILSAGFNDKDVSKFIYRFSVIFVSLYVIYFFTGYASHLSNSFSPLWPSKNLFSLNQFPGIIISDTLLFSYVRFFNHIQTWTFPLLISGILVTHIRSNKVILFVLLSVWWALLIQSGGRGTLLSLTVALAVVLILIPKNRRERVTTYFGSFLSGAGLYLLMFLPISDPVRAITRQGMSGRLDMWEKAWLMFAENPLFGNGPLSYSFIENSRLYFAHPHNFYLQVLSEWGILVFIIFTTLIFYGLFFLFKKVKLEKNGKLTEMNIGLTFSLVAALLHAGLSQIFHTPLSQIFLVLVLAWMFWYLSEEVPALKIKNSFVAAASLLSILIFLFLNSSNIKNSFKGYGDYLDKYQTNELYPRIWSQGLNE